MGASDYRRIARERLENNWGLSILVAFLAAVFGGSISGSGSVGFNIGERVTDIHPVVAAVIAVIVSVVSIIAFAQFIIGGTVQLGYCHFLLKQQDGDPLDVQDLFSQFHRFGAGFLQSFLRNLYILLWSLLLIVPGIIKTFSYAMTPFIMAEHPELTVTEAITASRKMMDGHKFDCFLLGLSFIGWNLLSVLTLGILGLWIVPYQNAAYAAFYRDISKN